MTSCAGLIGCGTFRSRASALGASGDASAEHESVVELKATARTANEVKADFERWKSYGDTAGDIADVSTPEQAQEYTVEALKSYANDKGYPVTGQVEEDIHNIAAGYGEEYFSSQGVDVDLRFKDLNGAAKSVAYAGVTYATGVNPAIAEVTVEALSDGKLDDDECVAIASVAGSVAGAAVGQAFGIPAPIGAWVGGMIGNVIGGVVSDIFGLGEDAEEKAERERKELAAALAQARQEATWACNRSRAQYWLALDQTMIGINEEWTKLECEIGTRFDLRWFGATPAHVFNFNRGVTLAEWCDVGGKQRGCCPYDYGCPYPNSGIEAGQLTRVVNAYVARGFPWPPCNARPTMCSLRQWQDPGHVHHLVRQQSIEYYLEYLSQASMGYDNPGGTIRVYEPRYRDLDAMTVRVVGDVMQTASAVSSELEVVREMERLRTIGLVEAEIDRRNELGDKARTRRRMKAMLGYGALGLGTAAVGYLVLPKGRR
jgi:hypothetical protein